MDRVLKQSIVALGIGVAMTIFACGHKVAEHHEPDEAMVQIEHVDIRELKIERETYEDRVLDTTDSVDWVDYTEPQTSYEDAEEETEVHSPYTFTEDEIWEMTRIVYLENGIVSESTDTTLYLTACVLLNRLYDWNYSNIYDVIFDGGQYSTANRYEDYDGSTLGSYGEGWSRSYNAVCTAIENTDRNPHFQSTFAQGEVYYVDPNTGETFCY